MHLLYLYRIISFAIFPLDQVGSLSSLSSQGINEFSIMGEEATSHKHILGVGSQAVVKGKLLNFEAFVG